MPAETCLNLVIFCIWVLSLGFVWCFSLIYVFGDRTEYPIILYDYRVMSKVFFFCLASFTRTMGIMGPMGPMGLMGTTAAADFLLKALLQPPRPPGPSGVALKTLLRPFARAFPFIWDCLTESRVRIIHQIVQL